jgi:regulatory protein
MPTIPAEFKDEYKKVERYCAFQEKCAFDVRKKLRESGVPHSECEDIILVLMEKGFIDPDRYCEAFTNDHVKIKRWGIQKIKAGLKAKSLPSLSIERALKKIDYSIFKENMNYLMKRKKNELSNEIDPQKQKAKLIRYLASCGYELPMILENLD